MGYYTSFEMVTVNPEDHFKIATRLGEVSDYDESLFEQTHKWYAQEEDCLKVSAEFPNIKFAINGIGEEGGDIWQKVYLNGQEIRSWRCDTSFPILE